MIARNQLGEAYATTTLKLRKRRDDFRGILNKKESKCSKLIEKMILCTVHTGLNCQEFIERAEYRKPDWLVQMEMIKERLAGGASTFLMKTKLRLNFSSHRAKREDHEGDPDEQDQGGNQHGVHRWLCWKPSA